jgi:hypothetical protein
MEIIQFNLNSTNLIQFNKIQLNWNLTKNTNNVESKGKEYCVWFNSLQFKNLNSIQLHYASLFNMELNFTKSTHLFH